MDNIRIIKGHYGLVIRAKLAYKDSNQVIRAVIRRCIYHHNNYYTLVNKGLYPGKILLVVDWAITQPILARPGPIFLSAH